MLKQRLDTLNGNLLLIYEIQKAKMQCTDLELHVLPYLCYRLRCCICIQAYYSKSTQDKCLLSFFFFFPGRSLFDSTGKIFEIS